MNLKYNLTKLCSHTLMDENRTSTEINLAGISLRAKSSLPPQVYSNLVERAHRNLQLETVPCGNCCPV